MDECKGMYVSERAPDYFIVKELNEGKGNARFCWKISAIRKGYKGKRLEVYAEKNKVFSVNSVKQSKVSF